ncbi:solute carrier family 24 member Nckx30C isoform X2 [Rhodnius prolixus]|uniref:solute carrier family 24 member Nckx30C isoform X2 n=1 Tax=Rhodnius prolixus TaxID=13249 RepID=UPI003D189562
MVYTSWLVILLLVNPSIEENLNNTECKRNATEKTQLFPPDVFSATQREQGAVVLHIIGVIYMFVALAIVCDEFFVPSLDVVIEKFGIAEDVAGATFMAAGGSAPELFTSVIGVFVSFDDVGIGTIVGSAVFNILFVIGMCALFSKTVLSLTWWPLFRDCTFYSASLIILIIFFRDNHIYWYEAAVLFSIYILYVSFMKWNQTLERFVKKHLYKNKVTRVRSTDHLMPVQVGRGGGTSSETSVGGAGSSSVASSAATQPQTNKFRHGLLQLMIHTIDPLHDGVSKVAHERGNGNSGSQQKSDLHLKGKVDEKATQLHAIASLKVLLDATAPHKGGATASSANHLKETALVSRPQAEPNGIAVQSSSVEEDAPEPLDMGWPDSTRKRITYLLVAPIVFPLWITLPDTRTPRGKKWFFITFCGSIVWIAAYSYLMVWWADITGKTVRIPPEVMGLTFLAAGTSIPDLITSVIVARKGFGDMAVSSSVGSNIFDVTVGLPVPWLLFGLVYGKPVEVNSKGMVCSIAILFFMLMFVILSIACFHWRMNKGLGFTMFLLYFVFVTVSLLFEYKVITCPV